jgi:hypothetical protein
MKIVAMILLAFGLVGLTVGTVSFTTQKKVVDLGPVDIFKSTTHSQSIPIAASVAALIVGGVLLVVGSRRSI